MAGGSGTRFWPLSREAFPKQFLKISGSETLLQQTFHRIETLATPERIYIAANAAMGETCLSQLSSFRKENLIIEPMPKNTAPAIGLAAFRLIKADPQAVMVALPSDHYIEDRDAFLEIIKTASEAALSGFLVTLGITPTRPETGYGYIQKGEKEISTNSGAAVFPVKAFREKPDFQTAERYIREGGYYWNSGMFVWKASIILKEMETYMPSMFEKLSLMDRIESRGEREKIFASIMPESIDYGIMEKSGKSIVVPTDIRWHDVGSLSAMAEVNETDGKGNMHRGNILGLENENSILYGDERLVAAIGLKDMMVVDTPDAVLVCPKDRAQDVKKIAERLRKDQRTEFMEHRKESHAWGSVSTLDSGSSYRARKVEMAPGGIFELGRSSKGGGHLIVLSGTAHFITGEEVLSVSAGGSFSFPEGARHRVENRGLENMAALMVQFSGF
ncbi:MAG: mannose-1-phosphate guanylyltransferase/mannose-6-phosphate isomerase [Nitrospinae bacterium]|nr:mannose-1-phosphate guanylyltransferase/mannose-6-phosphate isomerase [Nitrospinota bacterium]